MNASAERRSWRRALLLAAATLWLPALIPYWVGPLQECTHCMQTYALCLPLVPSVIVPTALGLEDALWAVVGVAVTLAVYAGLAVALRRLHHPASAILQTIVILGVGIQGYALSVLLRA